MTGPDPRPAPVTLPQLLAGWVSLPVPSLSIQGLSLDSRAVSTGHLFAAIQGLHRHGLSFAGEAIERGCAAIVYDPEGVAGELPERPAVPCLAVEGLSAKLGLIADRFFGGPSQQLEVIGITGTNGKTSCSHFLAEALEAAAVIGTLGWGRPGALEPTSHTTPDAFRIHEILFRLYCSGFRRVAMEASSHGLAQGRLNGVRFRGAVFTNFSRDHLDYHGSMAAYLEAKLTLFAWPGLQFAVINAADAVAPKILSRLPEGLPVLGYVAGRKPTVQIPLLEVRDIRQRGDGMVFEVCWEGRRATISAPLLGDFNVENLTATLAVLLAMGWDIEAAAERLRRVRAVPGRMEYCAGPAGGAVVDYAHTPDALANALRSLRRHCDGRLWVVFGCGGDRDRGKRAEMGRVAAELADRIVLTDDNPRSEDGDAIIADIRTGCAGQDPIVIRDRREAIRYALQYAEDRDLVLVAGKGHEETQEIDGVKTAFSDRQVIMELLNECRTICA